MVSELIYSGYDPDDGLLSSGFYTISVISVCLLFLDLAMWAACPLMFLFFVCEPSVNIIAVTHLRNVEIQGHCFNEGLGREC